MGLPEAYGACLLIEERRLILIPKEETVSIRSIKRGILFILARWSGASQLAFRALNKALASLSDLDGLHLYIADIDSDKTQELVSTLGDVLAGTGETYWLHEGEVHHKLSAYREEALSILRDYTEQTLQSRDHDDVPRVMHDSSKIGL